MKRFAQTILILLISSALFSCAMGTEVGNGNDYDSRNGNGQQDGVGNVNPSSVVAKNNEVLRSIFAPCKGLVTATSATQFSLSQLSDKLVLQFSGAKYTLYFNNALLGTADVDAINGTMSVKDSSNKIVLFSQSTCTTSDFPTGQYVTHTSQLNDPEISSALISWKTLGPQIVDLKITSGSKSWIFQ